MRSFNLKRIVTVSTFSLAAMLATSGIAIAQGNRGYDQRNQQQIRKQQEDLRKQREKARKEQERAAAERAKAEQQRQQWDREHNGTWINSGNDRSNGNGYYNGNANANRNNRYRVYRNGSYYNTDQRGAALLKQAVNEGYRQGFAAGRNDRSGRRRSSWTNSNVYQSGTFGYQSYVSQSQYQYYFRQGFQRGYQDGYNSRYQYGSNNGGGLNILGTILSQILNIQTY